MLEFLHIHRPLKEDMFDRLTAAKNRLVAGTNVELTEAQIREALSAELNSEDLP